MPPPGAGRKNRISPCNLSDLRVSVLKLLGEKTHHGDTENTEGAFPDRLLAAALESMQLSADLPKPSDLDYHLLRIFKPFYQSETLPARLLITLFSGRLLTGDMKEAPCRQL